MTSLSQSSSARSFRALGTENYQVLTQGLPETSLQVHETQHCIQEFHKSWHMSSTITLIFSKDCGGPGISLTTKGKCEGPSIPTERELGTSLVCVAGKLGTPCMN